MSWLSSKAKRKKDISLYRAQRGDEAAEDLVPVSQA